MGSIVYRVNTLAWVDSARSGSGDIPKDWRQRYIIKMPRLRNGRRTRHHRITTLEW